jgi:acetylglutamate synthase
MPSSGVLHSVALVTTDVLEDCMASIIRLTRIGLLVTAIVVPSSPILVTLMMEALCSSETSFLQ